VADRPGDAIQPPEEEEEEEEEDGNNIGRTHNITNCRC
jgi:hypothetical protein